MRKKLKSQKTLELYIGCKVLGPGFRTPLVVLEGPNKKGEWLVAAATVRMWVSSESLKPIQAPPTSTTKLRSTTTSSVRQEVIEIDLHGLRAHQAIEKLNSTLDRALLEDASEIQVIHGRGKGTLREVVISFADAHPQITKVSAHISNEGVTILYLG